MDRSQLEQVLTDLVVNGRDVMPAGGALTIDTAAAAEVPGLDTPHDLGAGRYAVLSVRDTGVGMDEETLGRIFEPFFSTKGRGTGLGLATVYGVAKQSGGTVTAGSAAGQGTLLHVYLPLVEGSAATGEHPRVDLPLEGEETLLLVEDEPELRDAIRDILEDQGYRVLAVEAPEEALAAAERHTGPSICSSPMW